MIYSSTYHQNRAQNRGYDYYPFGMGIKEREWKDSSFKYRFGFNGMEQDNEVSSSGNAYDFGARMYNPRLGRWLGVDRLAGKFVSWSPYNYAIDNPIAFKDPDGNDVVVTVTSKKVGTTTINLFSGPEEKAGIQQKTIKVPVYEVTVTNESGSTATYYFTRISYRGDAKDPKATPTDRTFDPIENGQRFLGKSRYRWGRSNYVLEVTPMSGDREDGYESYKGLGKDKIKLNRKYIQFHVKGASDGCLLAVGSGQFVSKDGEIDETNLGVASKPTQLNFMKTIMDFQAEDVSNGHTNIIYTDFEQLEKAEEPSDDATPSSPQPIDSSLPGNSESEPIEPTPEPKP